MRGALRTPHCNPWALLPYPHCCVLALANLNHTGAIPKRSNVLAHSGRQLCDAMQCMHAQALKSCLVYFCDFAAAGNVEAAATLVKQLGGQARAPNSGGASQAQHVCRIRPKSTILRGVTECCRSSVAPSVDQCRRLTPRHACSQISRNPCKKVTHVVASRTDTPEFAVQVPSATLASLTLTSPLNLIIPKPQPSFYLAKRLQLYPQIYDAIAAIQKEQ